MLDVARVVLRWLHAMAAVAWVGGCLFYLLVLNPAVASTHAGGEIRELLASVSRLFRDVVRASVALFLATGALLTVDRVSQPRITTAYVGVLALHIVVSGGMLWLAQGLGRTIASQKRRSGRWWLAPPYVILWLGMAAYLTAIVLKVLFEQLMRNVA